MAITQLTGKQIKDQSIDLTTDVTGVLPPANGGAYQYILLQDQKTKGTPGGTIPTANTWLQRNLNTIVYDDTGLVTISSNSFTLPAGTYEAFITSPQDGDTDSGSLRTRLYNSTDSSVVLVSTNRSGDATQKNTTSTSMIRGKFTISSSKTFRVDYISPATLSNTDALGAASNQTGLIEIYTEVELRKTA